MKCHNQFLVLAFIGLVLLMKPMNAEVNSGNSEKLLHKLTKNPFLIKKEVFPQKIISVVAEERVIRKIRDYGGYQVEKGKSSIFAPLKIGFSVVGDEGVLIPHLTGFSYTLYAGKKSYPLIHHTVYQESSRSYIATLSLPNALLNIGAEGEGYFDLVIALQTERDKASEAENIKTSQKTHHFQNSPPTHKMIKKRVNKLFLVAKDRVNLVFLIDNSASMNRNDPERLRFRSIYQAIYQDEFADKINDVALISFSDRVEVMLPFTSLGDFKEMLGSEAIKPGQPQFNIWTKGGRGNTDFAKAFLFAEALIKKNQSTTIAKFNQNDTFLIFLTDGASNYPYQEEHLKLKKLRVPVYTVGLSHPAGLEEYQPQVLQKISGESSGKFFSANSGVLKDVFDEFITHSTKGVALKVSPLKKVYDPSEFITINYYGNKNTKVKAYFSTTSSKGSLKKEFELPLYWVEGGTYFFSPISPIIATVEGIKSVRMGKSSESIKSLKGFIRISIEKFAKSGNGNKYEKIPEYNKTYPVTIRQNRKVFLNRAMTFFGINPHKPDIRYFSLTNTRNAGANGIQKTKSVFIDIKIIPPWSAKKMQNLYTNPPILKDFPLVLAAGNQVNKSIIFPVPSSKNKTNPFAKSSQEFGVRKTSLNQTLNHINNYALILKTSEGSYLERIHFSYQDKFNPTAVLNGGLYGLNGIIKPAKATDATDATESAKNIFIASLSLGNNLANDKNFSFFFSVTDFLFQYRIWLVFGILHVCLIALIIKKYTYFSVFSKKRIATKSKNKVDLSIPIHESNY